MVTRVGCTVLQNAGENMVKCIIHNHFSVHGGAGCGMHHLDCHTSPPRFFTTSYFMKSPVWWINLKKLLLSTMEYLM